jgi:succinate dehydrogenase / fumarate reductase cytochrome b subunit
VETTPRPSFFARHDFLIRRLHSLSGLVPVGAYMVVHLLTNSTVLNGARSFQQNVDMIHSLGVALPVVEWAFIFLPLIFHAAVGVLIAIEASPNTGSYPYGGNIRYSLQRATAWIALVFIFWHVFHMHGWIHYDPYLTRIAEPLGGHRFVPEHATSSAATALSSLPYQIFYAVGILACVYHLANGIWTSGITWGIWTTPAAQRRANWICAAFGIVVAVIGLSALAGMTRVNVEQAREVEERMIEAKQLTPSETATAAAPETTAPADITAPASAAAPAAAAQ